MEEVAKRQKDLDEKTKKATKDHEIMNNYVNSYNKNLSIIKESNMSESKRGSIKTNKKKSRHDHYKLEEPECEDNPSQGKIVPFMSGSAISKNRPKGRNSEVHVLYENLNDAVGINLDFKEDHELLNQNQDQRKQQEDEESQSFEPSDSSKQSKNNSSKVQSVAKKEQSGSGLAIVKEIKPRCAWARELFQKVTLLKLFEALIILLSVYNIIFIPLQGAYQIDYHGGFIFLEVLTLIVYAIDFYKILQVHKKTSKILKGMIAGHKRDEKRLWRSIDDERKDLRKLKLDMLISVISWIPFTIIFWGAEVEEPYLFIFYIKMLRLMKILPLYYFFNWFKKRALNMTRIVEMLFVYYAACHIIACSFICIAYRQDDILSTWLRRLPVPQSTGMRTDNNLDNLTPSSIYIHALNFTVNTVSHVAVGEITTISYPERIYNAFVIL